MLFRSRSFAGGYQIKTPHTDKEYDSVDIRFVIAKDSVGKEIPFFYLEDSTGHIDRLFFSHIKKVRYGIQQMGDDFTYHVLVTSAEEVKNDNGLKGYELRFYDFPTDDKPEMAAAYVIALAKKYSDNPSGINQEDKLDLGVSECSEKKCPELKPNPHISTSIAQKICSGDLKSSNDSYNVLYVGEINYDECVYDPLQNMTMLEMTLANLPGITDTQSNVLLICGNADELSADNCPEPINEGNFMLSFYRAKSLADLIEATRQKYAESLNIVSHPMGTALNERSVKVYYITGNVYLKETQEVEK